MAKKILMNAKTRKAASKAVYKIMKTTYFSDGVPLHELFNSLEDLDIVPVMEDNTRWNGFICGEEGECMINLAPKDSEWTPDNPEGYAGHGMKFYKPYENAGLRLTWYKCSSRKDRKFEVIGYVS